MKKIRSTILNFFLNCYNGGIFVVFNILMWRNDIWNKKKWTKVN